MKVGFVQSGAIGDIVIALPAAKWYVDRGYDVFWPIDHRYVSFFQRAAPYVNFLTVPPGVSAYDWHLGVPKQLLADLQVKDIFTMYLRLESGSGKFEFGQPLFLPEALKFDEYKYAIANVPFSEKWNLVIHRDPQHSTIFTASPPRDVSLYLVFMSAPVSRMVLMTLSSDTTCWPSPQGPCVRR
jgi:hypothetical protein